MIKVHLATLLAERKKRMVDLHKKTGITKKQLSSLYHEKNKGINFKTLEKICVALDCNPGDLLTIEPGN